MENCSDCRWCVWLVNKKYCIQNKQFTEQEYKQEKKKLCLTKPKELFYDVNNNNCKDCKIIFSCENLYRCVDIRQSSDLRYCEMGKPNCHDCIDCTLMIGSELNKEIMSTSKSFRAIGAISCRDWSDIYYCDNCYGNTHLFWCIWLRNKSYCIFNKQYTKEEYEILVPKIIEHMRETWERGEFFHPSLSPFWYNETVAQEYFPVDTPHPNSLLGGEGIKGADLFELGYTRSDYEAPKPVSDNVVEWSDLVEDIEAVSDSILKAAIRCELTWKLFRIQPQELAFYRKHTIPLPRKHPDQRHLERLSLRK